MNEAMKTLFAALVAARQPQCVSHAARMGLPGGRESLEAVRGVELVNLCL